MTLPAPFVLWMLRCFKADGVNICRPAFSTMMRCSLRWNPSAADRQRDADPHVGALFVCCVALGILWRSAAGPSWRRLLDRANLWRASSGLR